MELTFGFHAYGFLVGLGVVLSIWLVEWVLHKEKILLQLNPLLFLTILSGVIGARLYHLITDWQLYTNASLLDLVAVWNGGIGIIGALIGGGIGLWVGLWVQKKQQYFFSIIDSIALSLPFAQAIGRWGNYFNQELYGKATQLPWGLTISPKHLLEGLDPHLRYHPLFLYESVQLAVFGSVLWLVYKSKKASPIGSGIYTGLYCMFYSGVRFSLEFLRVETARVDVFGLNILSTAQWMMVLLFIIGVRLVVRSISYAAE